MEGLKWQVPGACPAVSHEAPSAPRPLTTGRRPHCMGHLVGRSNHGVVLAVLPQTLNQDASKADRKKQFLKKKKASAVAE